MTNSCTRVRRVPPIKLELVKDLARHLRAGHPWVYRRALQKPPSGLQSGEIIDITDRGRFVARGYYDALSHTAVRVLTRDPAEAIGLLYWRRKIARAVALRRAFVPFSEGDTDCCRLVHGEGDGLPGVIIDLYAKFAVIKLYSAGLTPHREQIVEALRGEVALEGIWGRDEQGAAAAAEEGEEEDGDDGKPAGKLLWGKEPPELITVRENGARLAVDVRGGQKTGMFLDQRENRLALRRYAKGRRALNCFAFSGGFSVQAALGGAREVTSVDRDAGALQLAKKNFELNELRQPHQLATADVNDFLAQKKAEGARYDLIILDPPAFAKTQKAVPAALDGYASLHRAALQLLPTLGILATASCSARVSADEFVNAIKEAAVKVGAELQLLEERRQPPDHPVSIAFPEGRYLKFFVFRRVD